jgi:hypothetical protein
MTVSLAAYRQARPGAVGAEPGAVAMLLPRKMPQPDGQRKGTAKRYADVDNTNGPSTRTLLLSQAALPWRLVLSWWIRFLRSRSCSGGTSGLFRPLRPVSGSRPD